MALRKSQGGQLDPFGVSSDAFGGTSLPSYLWRESIFGLQDFVELCATNLPLSRQLGISSEVESGSGHYDNRTSF